MREIKFRVWDKRDNEMVEVRQLNWEPEMNISIIGCWHEDASRFHLMQYTGLKDKNGKGSELYEGDVIGTISFKWVVYFGENQDRTDQLGWSVRNIQTGKTYFIDRSILCGEIIGNIYENPELLEAP